MKNNLRGVVIGCSVGALGLIEAEALLLDYSVE
jgi:hypothetical protein